MDYGKIRQAQRKAFVVPVTDLATSPQPTTASVDLSKVGLGQLGILAIQQGPLHKTYQLTDSPRANRATKFQIVQGVHHSEDIRRTMISILDNNVKRSVEFKASNIVKWYAKRGRKTAQSHKVVLGWDGLNDDKNLSLKKYQDLVVHLNLWGDPIYKVLGNVTAYKTSFTIGRDCFDPSTDEDDPLNVEGSRLKFANELMRQVNLRKIATQPLSKFITVSKITDGAPLSGLTTYDTFRVRIPDNNDGLSLGAVQSQIPDLQIKRVSFEDGFSTYEVVVTDGASAPAAITNESITTLRYCSTCPTGYTATTPRKAYQVTLNHGAATTQFTGVAGYSANEALSKSAKDGDRYIVYSTAATNETTFANAINTNGGTAFYTGTDGVVCELQDPTTYTWAAGDSVTRASKALRLTLADNECGVSRLADLQAAYPELTITGDTNPTLCIRNYTTTILSEPVAPECHPDDYEFTFYPEAFEGQAWQDMSTEPDEPDHVGVVFEGNIFKKYISNEQYDYQARDKWQSDGVHIEISTHSENTLGQTCASDVPVTVLSQYQYPSGEGWWVREMEEETAGYEMDTYRSNPAMREAFEQVRFSDVNKFYDTYGLEVVAHENGAMDAVAKNHYLYLFYFEPGKGKTFERAINQLLADSNSEVLPVSL